MLVELHCHTNYSKGTKVTTEGIHRARECIDYAMRKGLHGLAITDHDKVQGGIEGMRYVKREKKDFLVIPGTEVSTQDGHILALGIEEEIKPGLLVEETLEIVRSHGGITIASHPFDIKNEGVKAKAKKCDAVEEFNSLNLDRVSNFVSKRFAKKYNLATTVGSDAHCKEMIGHCVNKIEAETDLDSVLKAIKKGNVKIHKKGYIPVSTLQEWAVERLQVSSEDVKDYIDVNYRRPKKYLAGNMLKLVHKSPGKVDYFFDFLSYLGLSLSVPYSTIVNLPKLRYLF